MEMFCSFVCRVCVGTVVFVFVYCGSVPCAVTSLYPLLQYQHIPNLIVKLFAELNLSTKTLKKTTIFCSGRRT